MTSSGRTDAAQTLEARQIVVAFGGLRAIDDVSVNLAPGEVFGLIGPNGAGKTTLVNVLTGFQKPSSGKVLLGGVDLTGQTADQVARQGLART
ncbi:MAG TPA: ATP-binding cassette domain-containing protein, partial [Xanthobacteraceae bacterium]|nr:ATP-binding cassette domain-containing protein [Xanthobacteraceae bacterium]